MPPKKIKPTGEKYNNMSCHEVEITDTKKYDNAIKIFIEVTINGKKCGYPDLDGETHEFNFDMDYSRYRDNEKVRRDARNWAERVVQKRIEEHDPSDSPVGEKLEV